MMAQLSTTFFNIPTDKWTETLVSSWLRLIGVKEQYVIKLNEEEVDGQILLELTEDYLKKEIGMKSGQALLIIKKRNELGLKVMCSETNHQTEDIAKAKETSSSTETQALPGLTSRRDCKPRPFCQDGIDFPYVKHSVLQPESGVIDLITPCHEYKSFAVASKLDRKRLQAKFAKEVLKFGTGCMNIRSNGTIHFGVMDSKDGAGNLHGEIIGVPVLEKDIYVDALDYIERSFSRAADREDVRLCIRPPQFIEVIDTKSAEKKYVVEVDIVPAINIVKKKVYSVGLPNFNEQSEKVEYKETRVYRRVGAKTEPVMNEDEFYRRVRERDAQRKKAEHPIFESSPNKSQDLGIKLTNTIIRYRKSLQIQIGLTQKMDDVLTSIHTGIRKRRNMKAMKRLCKNKKKLRSRRKRKSKGKSYSGSTSSTGGPPVTEDPQANSSLCISATDTEPESETIFIYDGPVDASEFDECTELIEKLSVK